MKPGNADANKFAAAGGCWWRRLRARNLGLCERNIAVDGSWANRAMEEFAYNTGQTLGYIRAGQKARKGYSSLPCACHTISKTPRCGAMHLQVHRSTWPIIVNSFLFRATPTIVQRSQFTAGLHKVMIYLPLKMYC